MFEALDYSEEEDNRQMSKSGILELIGVLLPVGGAVPRIAS